jgi:hypothetical protein
MAMEERGQTEQRLCRWSWRVEPAHFPLRAPHHVIEFEQRQFDLLLIKLQLLRNSAVSTATGAAMSDWNDADERNCADGKVRNWSRRQSESSCDRVRRWIASIGASKVELHRIVR